VGVAPDARERVPLEAHVKTRVRIIVAAAATAALAATAPSGVALARSSDDDHRHDRGRSATKVFTLDPSTHGNPEGVAWDDRSDTFFVGTVGDGTIYRGKLKRSTATPVPVRAGTTAQPVTAATGMKVSRGKLYVAGAATGRVAVYKITRTELVPVASFETGPGGFLNDLVVTRKGDVFVTDSFRPTIWHITGAQVKAGTGTPAAINVAPEIPVETGPNQFNLNGIVAFRGGKELVVVDSNGGGLFRVVLDAAAPGGRRITQINAPALVGGDGMIVDRGRLIVVRGGTSPSLTFVKLSGDRTRGRIDKVRTDATLKGSSTVARADKRYLVVNADFNTNTQPFTVSGLARR
jgi:Cu-Zn family superoxide dismutase